MLHCGPNKQHIKSIIGVMPVRVRVSVCVYTKMHTIHTQYNSKVIII